MIVIEPADPKELEALMDAKAYRAFVEEQDVAGAAPCATTRTRPRTSGRCSTPSGRRASTTCSAPSPRRSGSAPARPAARARRDRALRRAPPRSPRATTSSHPPFAGRGLLPAPRPAGGRPAAAPRRVLHRLHAVPAGDLAGHAAGALRVADVRVPAHRPRRRRTRPCTTARPRPPRRRSWRRGSPAASKIVVSAALHPEYRKVLATYLRSTARRDRGRAVRRRTAAPTSPRSSGRSDADTACVIVGWPNFLGVVDALPGDRAGSRRRPARSPWRRPPRRSRSGCSRRRARSARTSRSARSRASATR